MTTSTKSITEIRTQVDRLERGLDGFIPQDSDDKPAYGSEREYSLRSIRSGLQEMLSDLKELTQSDYIFVQLSVLAERQNINIHLATIRRKLHAKNYTQACVQMDALKAIVRNYKIRGLVGLQADIRERIAKLVTESDQLKEHLNNVLSIEKTARDAQGKIQEAERRYKVFSNVLEELNKKSTDLGNIHMRSSNHGKSIDGLLSSIKSNDESAKEIIQQMKSQKQDADQYKESLESTENKYKESLESIANQYKESLESTTNQYKGSLESTENQYKGSLESTESQYKGSLESTESQYKGSLESTESQYKGSLESTESQYKKSFESAKNQYEQHLESYKAEHERLQDEADTLITNSKAALQYTTAQGISAAYNEKYQQAGKWYNFTGWIIGALLFVAASIAVGYDVLGIFSGKEKLDRVNWEHIIFRFSFIPALIAAAIFCASRYVKNKNLAEDYSYKSVLAKSMMAFMEKIDEKDRSVFMQAILNQILQDPLRKRHDEGTLLESFRDTLKDEKRPKNDNDGVHPKPEREVV